MEGESDWPCRSHTYPEQGFRSSRERSIWELEFRDCQSNTRVRAVVDCREDWGCEGGDCGAKCLWRKARQPWKQGDTAESCVGGRAITIASLVPHASIGSLTIDRLAHQAPDLPMYRIGPKPGMPSMCLMHQTREGPQAREPSKCLNGHSYRERLAKEAF